MINLNLQNEIQSNKYKVLHLDLTLFIVAKKHMTLNLLFFFWQVN